MGNVWTALGLTLLAGLATGIGSAIAFFARRTNYRFLSISTGFSAGVMLYVSFVEILAKGAGALTTAFGNYWGYWINAASFFAGMILIALIDNMIPASDNPHETHTEEEISPLHDLAGAESGAGAAAGSGLLRAGELQNRPGNERGLMRMGMFTAIAIGIHNFPEGFATFLAVLDSPRVGIAVAVAVALHNIPEGISVSVPIYYATGRRRVAFLYSFLSGLAEPVGAGIAYIVIRLAVGGEGGGIPPQVMGLTFGAVAGVMVYISLDELLPTSRAYGKGHDSIVGVIAGMMVMAGSLLLMR
ncbi:MAG: zinc transporter ZupT [bacterium]